MDKDVMVCIDNGILLCHKKEQNTAICSNMDEMTDYHIKWSKSETERQIPWYHLYVEFKIWHKWAYPQNVNRLIHTKNRLLVAKGEEGGKGMDWSLALVDANYYI